MFGVALPNLMCAIEGCEEDEARKKGQRQTNKQNK